MSSKSRPGLGALSLFQLVAIGRHRPQLHAWMAFEEAWPASKPPNIEAALLGPSRRAEAAGPKSGSLLNRLVSSAVNKRVRHARWLDWLERITTSYGLSTLARYRHTVCRR